MVNISHWGAGAPQMPLSYGCLAAAQKASRTKTYLWRVEYTQLGTRPTAQSFRLPQLKSRLMHSALTLLTDDLAGGKLAGETLIISSRFDLTTLTSELRPWQAPKWWKKKTCWELEDNSYTCALSPKREEWKQTRTKRNTLPPPRLLIIVSGNTTTWHLWQLW